MEAVPEIRLVAATSNERGDILTRLMGDVFHSLGFVDLMFNVARTGREVDILGNHEHEDRRLVAECKAQSSPIGGADINKFAGVLQAEQNRSATPISGYFISLSGFTPTAREQEAEFAQRRMALIDPLGLIKRLQAGGIIAPRDKAIDRARSATKNLLPSDRTVQVVEIVASRLGWLWGVYYGATKESLTHVSFVHADGNLLPADAASFLLEGGRCEILGEDEVSQSAALEAVSAYRLFTSREFGSITLEGLQADQEIGARKFRLESLYVPAHLTAAPSGVEESGDESIDLEDPFADAQTLAIPEAVPLASTIAANPRLAILGPPGSGKSTLVKRLAVAYADSSRRQLVHDSLPELDCLPVVIRCRQLKAGVASSIVEIIEEQIVRAERPDLKAAFGQAVREYLRTGAVLLLLDGMDEIGTVADKMAFARQLRVFLTVYPAVRLVATSREAGFRPIAGTFAEVCSIYHVAELSNVDIERLSVAWHQETIGNNPDVERDARRLAFDICNMDRVRRLASNPLLLTTLLLVRRWVGQMPRRRSVLYGKAVEVLLMTWNVEGHAPVDPDEALPQLGFVAHSMMVSGKQTISVAELRALLRQARTEMPDLLMHAKFSVSEMIDKIEERSSLLTLAGHEVVNGTLQAIYEFKHLTFQEYLCARALAEGWLPTELSSRPVIELIRPYLRDIRWTEVVVLTAALAGRSASVIVAELVHCIEDVPLPEEVRAFDWGEDEDLHFPVRQNIARCLADDVPVSPSLLRGAFEAIVNPVDYGQLALELLGSRYEQGLRAYVLERLQDARYIDSAVSLHVELVGSDFAGEAVSKLAGICGSKLSSESREDRLFALSLLVFLGLNHNYAIPPFVPRPAGRLSNGAFRRPTEQAALLLSSGELSAPEDILARWALGWSGLSMKDVKIVNRVQQFLLKSWFMGGGDYGRLTQWALITTPIIGGWGVDSVGIEPVALDAFFSEKMEDDVHGRDRCAVYLCSYYLDLPWPRERLAAIMLDDDQFLSDILGRMEADFVMRMLVALGEPRETLNRFRERSGHRSRRRVG